MRLNAQAQWVHTVTLHKGSELSRPIIAPSRHTAKALDIQDRRIWFARPPNSLGNISVLTETNDKRSVDLNVIQLDIFAATHIGRVRKNNEDNFLIADLSSGHSGLLSTVKRHNLGERGSLLLVSDGMGGALAGEVASRMAVDHLHQELVVKQITGEPQKRLTEAVERANLAIWHAGRSGAQSMGMGTTITASLISGPKAYIAEVGDSRAYLVRCGAITQLTKDQSMVQRLVDEGIISPKQAAKHPNRNLILQALGTQKQVNVVLTTVELCHEDIMMLCTDGLSNKVPDEEIKDIILGSISVESACRNLIEAANRHGGEDNITVVIAKFFGDDLPSPEIHLDTTDSQSLTEVKERLRHAAATREIHAPMKHTQEIFRRTQPIVVSRELVNMKSPATEKAPLEPAVIDNNSRQKSSIERVTSAFTPSFEVMSPGDNKWKLIVLALLIVIITVLLIKLR